MDIFVQETYEQGLRVLDDLFIEKENNELRVAVN